MFTSCNQIHTPMIFHASHYLCTCVLDALSQLYHCLIVTTSSNTVLSLHPDMLLLKQSLPNQVLCVLPYNAKNQLLNRLFPCLNLFTFLLRSDKRCSELESILLYILSGVDIANNQWNTKHQFWPTGASCSLKSTLGTWVKTNTIICAVTVKLRSFTV